MNRSNSGGPAFPCVGLNPHSEQARAVDWESEGMTLRDYFAAKAMPAAMSIPWFDIGYQPADGLDDMQQHARLAYQMADAMLAERAK